MYLTRRVRTLDRFGRFKAAAFWALVNQAGTFNRVTSYSMPLTGNPAYNPGNNGFYQRYYWCYRLFPAEVISFGQRLRFTIQHGPTDDQPANYSSVAFWYGQATYSRQVTDALNTTDQASRASHQTSCNSNPRSVRKKERAGR